MNKEKTIAELLKIPDFGDPDPGLDDEDIRRLLWAYNSGDIGYQEIMDRLDLDWYGQFLELLGKFGVPLYVVTPERRAETVRRYIAMLHRDGYDSEEHF